MLAGMKRAKRPIITAEEQTLLEQVTLRLIEPWEQE